MSSLSTRQTGLVTLSVTADTKTALKHACGLVFSDSHTATHFIEGTDQNDVPFIRLLWTDSTAASDIVPSRLVVPMSDPNQVADLLETWLEQHDGFHIPKINDSHRGGDGTLIEGFHLTKSCTPMSDCVRELAATYWYEVLTLYPAYVYYGK